MSYNVRLFDLYNWSQNKRTRDKMFQLIRETGPDIACFQEYFNSSNSQFPVHDSLIRNQKFRYSHLFFNVQINNGHQFGIATYSAYPIVNRDVIEFSGTHNVAIISDIKINTDTLRVINCHLESVRFLAEDYVFMDSLPMLSEQKKKSGFNGISNRLLTAAKKRAIQADAISKKVEQSPYPTMVCGDFNDTPSSYTYQKIARLLNDSFTYYKFGVGGTYNRFFPPLRIDYILYNSAVNCHNFQTIKSNYSDHYPVIGYYSLQ